MNEFVILPQILLILVILVIGVIIWAVPVRLWIEAVSAGVRVGLGDLIGMRLRKVSPSAVIRPLITATKAGLPLTAKELEGHYLAGGRGDRVVKALISAHKANIHLSFHSAAAVDLAGREVLEAVQMTADPKDIHQPRRT